MTPRNRFEIHAALMTGVSPKALKADIDWFDAGHGGFAKIFKARAVSADRREWVQSLCLCCIRTGRSYTNVRKLHNDGQDLDSIPANKHMKRAGPGRRLTIKAAHRSAAIAIGCSPGLVAEIDKELCKIRDAEHSRVLKASAKLLAEIDRELRKSKM